MKRKFGLGHLKVSTSSTTDNAEIQNGLDKTTSDDFAYTQLPRPPYLDAKTESELRKACAFILKDLKPSGHDLEDTRMKTDILIGSDALGQDSRYVALGDLRVSNTDRKNWPLSKRDANRTKDRTTRTLVETTLDSWGEERPDGRISRSTNRQGQTVQQFRRRAPTAVTEEQSPIVPSGVLPNNTGPAPQPKEENYIPKTLPVDSSENSSLGRSVGSMNQIRSTSTGITSAVITPAGPSQRTSENGIGGDGNNTVGVPDTRPKWQTQGQSSPERIKLPSAAGPRAMGSNLEAQAVPIISRRATHKHAAENGTSEGVSQNKSLSDLRSASLMVELPVRPLTPEPSRARSAQGTAVPQPRVPISRDEQITQSNGANLDPRTHFDYDDSSSSSSITDDDSSSQEDKENYMSETNASMGDHSATSAGPPVARLEGLPSRKENTAVSSNIDLSSPQPIVHPKNPLRYTETDAPLVNKDRKLSEDIRDKSEEPLATARAKIDAREHSRRTSVYLEQQQQQQQQRQGSGPMWETDAKPQPLNLKPKTSNTILSTSPPDSARLSALPILSQPLSIDPTHPVPTHVPSPLPPLKHEQDSSITVKDFWKPTPPSTATSKPTEPIRSFSRPGTSSSAQHRRQPAQESIDGLVQPLRPFSPSLSDRNYSPVVGGSSSSWSAEYIPNRSYERQAVAGPSGTQRRQSQAAVKQHDEPQYHAPVISVQSASPYPRPPGATNFISISQADASPSSSASPSVPTQTDSPSSPTTSHSTSVGVTPGFGISMPSKKEPRGIKKLLHRLGGGDVSVGRKVVVQQQQTDAEDEFYDDDQACEAPVVRFGRGW